MKYFAVVAFVALAIASASADLNQDFQDFEDLLPLGELKKVALDYALNDAEVKEALKYMLDAEFKSVWTQVFGLKEVKDLVNYLENAGVPVVEFLNKFADFFGLPHYKPTRFDHITPIRTGGLNGLVQDLKALLPKDKLKALFDEKMKTSAEFKALFDKLSSADFNKLVEFANNSKELQSLLQKLRDHNIDVDKFFDLVAGFFGWGY